ncbi:hypothetical protein IAU60_002506 [Kwoniella sp. DSM 27419]
MSSSSFTPPPLPASLLSSLLPHLLPPSQLPQELLSRSLLQRLLYLPPGEDDLDAYLSPFPSTPDQPISSRLLELSRGHHLGLAEYTREGEEVYARVRISSEGGYDDATVQVWFEFEGAPSGAVEGDEVNQGRGWVYHSTRVPVESSHVWTLDPSAIPPPSSTQEPAEENAEMDLGQAPDGYWAAFDDSPTSSPSDSTLPTEEDGHAAEDAYWAQYSRPATAPITPAPMTPGEPIIPKPTTHGSQEETAKKLAESLRQLGLDKTNGDAPASFADPSALGFGVSYPQAETAPSKRGFYTPHEETGDQVKDRLKGKIGSSLHDLWKEYTSTGPAVDMVDDGEMEQKAMEWLRIARAVIDSSSSSGSGTASPTLIALHPPDDTSTRVQAKLETLWEMYEVLNEEQEEETFFRLVEGVIRRQDNTANFGLGSGGAEDMVMRQEMYYE